MLRTLVLVYLTVFALYLGIAAGVTIFIGSWTGNLITAGAIGLVVSSMDLYTRLKALRERKRQMEAFKNTLRSLGVDVDKVMAEHAQAAKEQAAKRQSNAN